MLRDEYVYNEQLVKILDRFALNGVGLIEVKYFGMLSPDSFLWHLRMTDGLYYLYAEDFVESLDEIAHRLATCTNNQTGHFVEVKQPKAFEGLSPVKAADFYAKPKDYESTMMQYTADSGFDHVFLYKIDEPAAETKVAV